MKTSKPLNINATTRREPRGLVAHVMAITHFIHRYSMVRLAATQRYPKLNLGYESYITLLAEHDYSPSELAERLNITRQACSKAIKELEHGGLIQRHKNPDDSRSHRLTLTLKGRRLIRDGIQVTNEIQNRFAEVVGADTLEEVAGLIETLLEKLELPVPRYPVLETIDSTAKRVPQRLNILLPLLNEYLYQELVRSLSDRGFPGLKPSFSQVLSLIVLDQGRIQYIASLTGVTKQAIATTANELVKLGYITKEPDPHDKRQLVLRLSDLGETLMAESERSVEALAGRLADALGRDDYALLESTLDQLYERGIEHQGLPGTLPINIELLSQQLLQELGAQGARALAQHLMTITRGTI